MQQPLCHQSSSPNPQSIIFLRVLAACLVWLQAPGQLIWIAVGLYLGASGMDLMSLWQDRQANRLEMVKECFIKIGIGYLLSLIFITQPLSCNYIITIGLANIMLLVSFILPLLPLFCLLLLLLLLADLCLASSRQLTLVYSLKCATMGLLQVGVQRLQFDSRLLLLIMLLSLLRADKQILEPTLISLILSFALKKIYQKYKSYILKISTALALKKAPLENQNILWTSLSVLQMAQLSVFRNLPLAALVLFATFSLDLVWQRLKLKHNIE